MAGSSSLFVAGLTAAALTTVGVLTWQASASVPGDFGKPRASGTPAAKAAGEQRSPTALPRGSGSGERVVYSVDGDRVWLVGAGGKVLRTYLVEPGTVDPAPGTYAVGSRSNSVIGTDGTPVEHIVRFTSVDGVTIGFSTAVGRTRQVLDSVVRTGGIREEAADGDAMWQFAMIGRKVVVVP